MRLLYLTDVYPRHSEIFITREIRGLARRGFEIVVFALERTREPVRHAIEREDATRVVYESDLARGRLHRLLLHLRCTGRHPFGHARALRAARSPASPDLRYRFHRLPHLTGQLLPRLAVDRLHAHFGGGGMLSAWLAHKVTGLPFSVTLHGSGVLVRPYPNLGRILADADFVACVSRKIRDDVRDRHGVPDDRLFVLPSGVDTAEFPLVAPVGELRILCVARLHPVKGLVHLIDACAMLRDRGVEFACTLVGEGRQRAELERRIVEAGLGSAVRLAGAVANERLPEVHAGHSLFVLPSLSEGLGVAVIEAMASGLPVVASAVGGIPELIEDGVQGRLVPPADPAALADAIEALRRDPAELRAMGLRGRQRAEREFDLGRGLDRLEGLFRRPAGQGRRLG